MDLAIATGRRRMEDAARLRPDGTAGECFGRLVFVWRGGVHILKYLDDCELKQYLLEL